ncbi:MAG: hypothetical protein ACXVZL_06295, partial [Gaiellaceae bacterium]
MLIEPLSPVETDELIERLGAVDDALRSRIRNAAEGNPLFVEEMLAIVRETADDVAVPPTIQALLAARIDGLAPAERSLLERGAVEGQLFHAGAARALAPDEPAPETLLASLVRRDLIRPAPPIFRGEDAYRFRHILLRDAAYERLPKGRRAELHERLAEWLEAREDELVEADELVGHHLDQAYRYGLELGHADEQVALRAGRRLGAAGSRAVDRWDYLAADGLLQRAFELLPPEQRPLRLWRQRGMNLAGTGRLREAQALTAEAERLAVERGDEIGAERARIAALTVSRQGEGDTDEWRRAALRGIRLFEHARDVEALTEACVLLFWAGFDSLRNAEAIAALEPVLALRQSSGLPAYTGPLVVQLATAHMMSPTPVPAALAFLDEHDAGDATAYVRATLLAMLGRFDEARSAEQAAERRAQELGERIQEGGTGQQWFLIETLAGDPTAAVPKLRRGCTLLQELEDTGYLSTEAAQLGLALVAQG